MICILGAGGFGREILNLYSDLGREDEVFGFIEENCGRIGSLINNKPVYDFSKLNELDRKTTRLICAIGTPLRKRLVIESKQLGFAYDTVIHPSVIKSKWNSISEGAIICAGSILTNQIQVGKCSIVNLACTIGHDVNIGEYSTISPGVNISGRVSIGNECFIGTGTCVVEKIQIGDKSFIGAGSVVTQNIPSGVLAVGVPAKPIRVLSAEDWIRMI
jgi:sugar O-acyltransferase (sialic acid O-acetyltransferase NeuD family)